ncbi:MAG: transglycosylase SLT domain-containing protein [Patescibacteria group bacterium]
MKGIALIMALVQVESGGNDWAIGDQHLVQKAYGCLQIRQPCADDVNRRYGTRYRAEDCLGNPELSREICQKYLALYATRARLGREPTDQDRARIWNGGPDGWKKKSTVGYWKKVSKKMQSR